LYDSETVLRLVDRSLDELRDEPRDVDATVMCVHLRDELSAIMQWLALHETTPEQLGHVTPLLSDVAQRLQTIRTFFREIAPPPATDGPDVTNGPE